MGYLIGASVFSTVWLAVAVGLLIALALPLGWLWMLIDALFREECDYPGGTAGSNNRLLWVLLILFVHVTAIAYFVMVYRPMRARGTTHAATAAA